MAHNNTEQLTRQRLPLSQKDKEWREETVESIYDMSVFSGYSPYGYSDEKRLMLKAYQYYNGQIDDSDYTHVTEPYGEKRDNFPAKINNYPIIKPVVDLLLGEKAKRPFDFTVKVANDDVVTNKTQEKNRMIRERLQEEFLQELERMGYPVNSMSQEDLPPIQEMVETFEHEYRDGRATIGQAGLEYIIESEDVRRKILEGWFHWLVAGMVVSKVDVISDEVIYDILNPLQVDYDKSPETTFIEDGDWAAHRKLVHASDVIDQFYDELTPAQIDRLEEGGRNSQGEFLIWSNEFLDTKNRDYEGRLIEVIEVFWKSRKKIGIVTYEDEYGMMQEMEVDEDYETQEGEEVEWYWVNEVWQGYRIDGDIYLRVEPMGMQRGSINNPSKCKLPINGRRYSDVNSENISLAMLGIPYQITYNIYKYRLETAIAKSKDVIAQLDINMIPDDWTMDEFMYYVDATGIAWVDYSDENFQPSPQHQSVLDMSIQVIQDYIALLESLLAEWERLSGITRQRQGQIGPYETKKGAEHAIVQSSHVTEDYFMKYNQFEERDLAALLDASRWAWVNGKRGTYFLPDGSEKYLEVDGIEHMESEYGVFLSNSREDLQKNETLKNLAESLVQNGTPLSEIIEVLDAESTADLKQKIKKAEESRLELQSRIQQMEMQQQQAETQMKQREIEAEMQMNKRDNDTKILIEQMKQDKDMVEAMEDRDLDREEMQTEEDIERERLDIEREKNDIERMKAKQSSTNSS